MVNLSYRDFFESNASFHIADSIFSDQKRSPHHNHDFYEFFLVRKGGLLHHLNGEVYRMDKNDICFIRKEDAHSFSNADVQVNSIITNIAFTKEEFLIALKYINVDFNDFKLATSRSTVNTDNRHYYMLDRIDEIYSMIYDEKSEDKIPLFRNLLLDVMLLFLMESQTS